MVCMSVVYAGWEKKYHACPSVVVAVLRSFFFSEGASLQIEVMWTNVFKIVCVFEFEIGL